MQNKMTVCYYCTLIRMIRLKILKTPNFGVSVEKPELSYIVDVQLLW